MRRSYFGGRRPPQRYNHLLRRRLSVATSPARNLPFGYRLSCHRRPYDDLRSRARRLTTQMKTILVVDDEPDQREIYRAVLRHAGYHVLEAGNAREGIRIARESLPDLILLDIALPLMDGWQAARVLKQDPRTASIPICAISARVLTDEHRPRLAEAGFECYLLKPIEPRQILREVAERVGPAVMPEPPQS